MFKLLALQGTFCQLFSAKVLKFKIDHSLKGSFVLPVRDGENLSEWKYKAKGKLVLFSRRSGMYNYTQPLFSLQYVKLCTTVQVHGRVDRMKLDPKFDDPRTVWKHGQLNCFSVGVAGVREQRRIGPARGLQGRPQ